MKFHKLLTISVLTLSCFSFLSCDRLSNKKNVNDGIEEIKNEQERLAKLAESEGLDGSDMEDLENATNTMADSMAAMGGETAKMGRAIKKFTASQVELGKTLNPDLLSKAMDFSSLTTAKDYDLNLGYVQEYLEANNKMLKYVSGNDSLKEMTQYLKDENLNKSETQDFIGGFQTTRLKQRPHLIAIRESDTELCKVITHVINLLEEHQEKWSWNENDEQVQFENDEVLEEFNEKMILINEIATKQAQDQAALMRAAN
ncbi:MAG: hypothetical protein ACSHX0_04995 [Akkermansiaceae bacterium]